MTEPRDEMLPVRGLNLHLLRWDGGDDVPFLLVHGLASNARTWAGVGRVLAEAGHPVVAVDQRGHGLSDKPETGYGFAEVTADLTALVRALGWERPVIAGQSWGGNVVLELAAREPDLAAGIVLVDGGFIELNSGPDRTWERISVELRPPPLAGTPRAAMEARLRQMYPDWSDEGIGGTLANMETLPDGTVRPWLTLDRHLQILRALWEQHPPALYPRVTAPVLMTAATGGDTGAWAATKREAVADAEALLPAANVVWFHDTAHDIHVHRPAALARLMLGALEDGFFRP